MTNHSDRDRSESPGVWWPPAATAALDEPIPYVPAEQPGSEVEALRTELALYKRGGATLGQTIDWQCRAVLDATGLHHLIDEDGDGDWGLVWEHLAELRPRLERAERALADERAKVAHDRAVAGLVVDHEDAIRHRDAMADTGTSHVLKGRQYVVTCEWCDQAFFGTTKAAAMEAFRWHETERQNTARAALAGPEPEATAP